MSPMNLFLAPVSLHKTSHHSPTRLLPWMLPPQQSPVFRCIIIHILFHSQTLSLSEQSCQQLMDGSTTSKTRCRRLRAAIAKSQRIQRRMKRECSFRSQRTSFSLFFSLDTQMNEAKDNLDAFSVQIKKLPRESQFNYLNVLVASPCHSLEESRVCRPHQSPPVGFEVPVPVHGEKGSSWRTE